MNDIHRFLAGELSTEELLKFETWRSADPANEQLVREYEEVWEASGNYQVPEFDSKAVFDKLDLGSVSKSRRLPVWSRRAAIVAVLVLAGWLAYPYVLGDQNWTSAHGEMISEVQLVDGSMVFLNNTGTLEYPDTFEKRSRTVKLNGEAFFEIAKYAERPFVIEAGATNITVLGTSFGVDIDSDSRTTTVRVTEGEVRLQPTGSKLYLDIVAGEGASYDETSGALQKLRQPELNQLAWHTKTLAFLRTPVSEVVTDLSEAFDVQIDLRQSGVADCTYTSPQPFKNANVEKVLEAMSIVFQMRVTSPEEGYFLLIGGSCD